MPYKEFSSTLSTLEGSGYGDWVRAWVQGWMDAGLVRTADTGQVDLATVVRPPSSAHADYAIFRFDDDLQATAPIFMRFDFGVATTSVTSSAPRLRLTVGRGTDGAGNILGTLFGPTIVGAISGGITAVNALYLHYAASGPGWFGFLPFVNADSAVPNYFDYSIIIERSRSTDGAPSAAGLMVAHGQVSSNRPMNASGGFIKVRGINYQTGAYMQGVPPVVVPYDINGTVLSQSSSLASGSIGPVFPWVILAPGCIPWQSCVILSIPSGDFPGGIFSTTLCGNRATFRPVAASIVHARWGVAMSDVGGSSSFSSYIGPAIRWEE